MSPSRGDAGEGPESDEPEDCDEEIKTARTALRKLLAGLHVLETLPERSRILAVDAELPVHAVVSAVLAEQHPLPRPLQWCPTKPPGQGSADANAEAKAEGPSPLSCGVVSPSLPCNVLAEVCEFGARQPRKAAEQAPRVEAAPSRRWTSPDDGWGKTAAPPQDMERMMPMGMPLTVGELAEFLSRACATGLAEDGGTPERWADKVGAEAPSTGADKQEKPAPCAEDPLDWSLAQWRRSRMAVDTSSDQTAGEPASRITEEQTRFGGTVLVHQVPLAPPRPILCADDPDANLLKAVELLLAYPDLDAVPVVSQSRCTVVAHLTLSYCLSYMLQRLRGTALKPLAELEVGHGIPKGDDPPQRKFDAAAAEKLAKQAAEGNWAECRQLRMPLVKGVRSAPWVLHKQQSLRDLLAFFSSTSITAIPIVEEDPSGRTSTPGVVGVISRRDVIQYIGLAMQSVQKHAEYKDCTVDKAPLSPDTPVETVFELVRKYRVPNDDEVPPPFMDQASTGLGVSMIYEEDITMKALLLRVLVAENRKVLFVKDRGFGDPPQMLRLLSLSDIWLLLIGTDSDCKATQDSKSTTSATQSQEEPLSATDATDA